MKTTLAFLLATCLGLQAGPKPTFLPYPPTPAATADAATDKGATNITPAAQATVEPAAPETPAPAVAVPPAASPPDRQATTESKPAVPAPAAAVSPGVPPAMLASPVPKTTAAPSSFLSAPTTAPSAPGSAAAQPAGVPPAATPVLTPSPDATAGVTPPRNVPSLAMKPVEEVATNTFNFPAIDLNTFLGFYAELVNRTILRPAGLPAPLITFKTQTPLTRTESLQAFDTVLAMNGITTINVGEKFVKVVPVGQTPQEAAKFSKLSASQLPEAAQYLTHLVQLKYVKPSEIVPVIQSFGRIPGGILSIEGAQMLVIRDYAENVKRMLELIEQIDIAVPSDFISEVIPIKYALASEMSSVLSSLSSGGATTSLGAGAAGAGTGARTTGRTGFGSRLGGGYGTTTPGMLGASGTTPFGTTTPGTTPGTAPSFSDRLRSIIQKASGPGEIQIFGTMKIIADERSNSLLVFASRDDMKTIKEIIAKLDTIPPQVLIEALIVEVDLVDSSSSGVSWLKRPVATGNFSQFGAIQNSAPLTAAATNLFTSGLNWWGKYNGDFDVAVVAAANDSRAHILSRPHVVTTHANRASIQIGGTRPYPTGSSYGGYMGGSYNQIQQLFIGISLDVMPLINAEGLVVMDIQQSIDSVGEMVSIANVGDVPSTISRACNAKIAVRDRETVMLGGFISEDRKKSNQGVPFLKDIPLLGYLFRSGSRSEDRRELIVLIRPTVLPTPEAAAAETTKRTDSMPLTREAEQDSARREAQLLRESKARTAHSTKVEPVFMDVEPKESR